MRPLGLVVAALVGCNQIFEVQTTDLLPDADLRPDRDRDMIADVEDPCIAVEADYTGDVDGDGTPNGSDPCPLGATGVDGDGDGLAMNCDPFEALPGDSPRCTTMFASIDVNTTLWRARPGESPIAAADGYMVGTPSASGMIASGIATDRVAPTTGTTMIAMRVGAYVAPYSVRFWISAGLTPTASDVACDFMTSTGGTTVTVLGASDVSTTNGPPAVAAALSFLFVHFQPGKAGTNVRCSHVYVATTGGLQSATAKGHFDGELGAQGFATVTSIVRFEALTVFHREDQPDLP